MQKAELAVALDLPSSDAIPAVVSCLPQAVTWYKVGLELFISEGPACLRHLGEAGKKVFLDLKLHDIPRTVARAVSAAATHGVDLLTVHAGGGRAMLEAAAESAAEFGEKAPKLVAITTLTSLAQQDLEEMGVSRPLRQHTHALGQLAIESGIDGLVCSAQEVAEFRDALGPDTILVTPGIRPAERDPGGQVRPGNEMADQKRVATPAMAVKAGSSLLVVGRPILEADDPAAAAQAILDEMAATRADR